MTVLDHLVVAVPDLLSAVDEVAAALGVRPEFGGVHEGLGTHNALLSLGDCYLELIAPDPAQPDAPSPRPFDVAAYSAASLVAFAVRPDTGTTIEEVVEVSRSAGHDPGPVLAMHRLRPDGERIDWQLTFPDPRLGPVPFVIDWGATRSPAATAPGGVSLERFVVCLPEDESEIRGRLAALHVDVTLEAAPVPGLTAVFRGPGGSMWFAP